MSSGTVVVKFPLLASEEPALSRWVVRTRFIRRGKKGKPDTLKRRKELRKYVPIDINVNFLQCLHGSLDAKTEAVGAVTPLVGVDGLAVVA